MRRRSSSNANANQCSRGAAREAHVFEPEALQHDEALGALEAVAGVIECISAQQASLAPCIARPSKAGEGDGTVQELNHPARAGVLGDEVGRLARAQRGVPHPAREQVSLAMRLAASRASSELCQTR